jgi:uncharacterized cupredoxin-like copper-binding protein
MRSMACLLAAAALAVAGCGSSSKSGGSGSSGGSTPTPTPTSTPSSSSASSAGGGHSVPVAAAASGLKFTTKTLKAKAGTVTLHFKNPASIPHGVAVEGHGVDKDSKIVTNGSTTLTVKLKPGKYTFYCPVPGHRAAGMVGTLTVS